MEADISGYQRKVVSWRVRPTRRELGESGIALREGRTLPFEVTRGWSAPAGVYPEQWFLVDPASREVIHAGPRAERAIWGLQGLTELTDQVRPPLELAPGTYVVVFSLGGIKGGEVEVEAVEISSQEAA
jgi:hypothetical protein